MLSLGASVVALAAVTTFGMPTGAQSDTEDASHDDRAGCDYSQAVGEVRHWPRGFDAESFWVGVDFWVEPGDPRARACLLDSYGAPNLAWTGPSMVFYFFTPDNVEVIVKVLDGCKINGFFWVYAAGLTDIPWRLDILVPSRLTSAGQLKKSWYIEPGEPVIPKRLYRDDNPLNPWSPDLLQDSTGALYHRLSEREPPPRNIGFYAIQQVADNEAIACRSR